MENMNAWWQWFAALSLARGAWVVFALVLLLAILIVLGRSVKVQRENRGASYRKEAIITIFLDAAFLVFIVLVLTAVTSLISWLFGQWFAALTWLKKVWVIYGLLAANMFVWALFSEIAQIKNKIDGGNGMMMFTALALSFFGLVLMSVISLGHWMLT